MRDPPAADGFGDSFVTTAVSSSGESEMGFKGKMTTFRLRARPED
jgi:hypothetical protein